MKNNGENRGVSAAIIRYRCGFLLLLLAALFLLSCGTVSENVTGTEPAGEEGGGSPPEDSGGAELPGGLPGELPGGFPGEFSDDPPSVVLSPESPPESPETEELIEPVFDPPEAAREPQAPPEPPLAALPEALAPVFPDPEPLTADTGEGEPEIPAQPPVPAEAPPPVPEETPVPPRTADPSPMPPAPPPYIRPAEEYEDPPAREPVPRPLIPDPPARPAEIPGPGIVYSRVVRATVGQLVEIPFRGTGWVYLGELGARPGIVYGSRRLDPEGQSFIFHTEAPGTYGLKFYKQDFVRDYVLNDHVQVIVGEPPEAAALGWFNPAIDRGRVTAEPRWPSALEEAEALGRNSGAGSPAVQGGTGRAMSAAEARRQDSEGQDPATVQDGTGRAEARSENVGTQDPAAVQDGTGRAVAEARGRDSEGQDPATVQDGTGQAVAEARRQDGGTQDPATAQDPDQARGPEIPEPGDYPERARQEFEAGRVASALSILDQFRERYPSGSDEAWWLYGQFYEANSPSRDIRAALDYYRRLIREYPQSRRYNEARRRIAYLERYYINIR